MSYKLLFPNKFKIFGWFILIPSFIIGVYLTIRGFDAQWLNVKVFSLFSSEIFGPNKLFSLIEVDLTNTIIGSLFIAGALLVGFSKEKNEDEFIANLRLSSLLWAVFVNYVLLFLAFILVYGTAFLTVMVYNMFTVLLIFIIRFNYILYKTSKTFPDEK
ncbi:MAG: hypothetical protein ABI760_02780 [Ferruginibacter sp.]